MFNLDDITNENNKEHDKKWPYISDHPYRILTIGGSGSGKTNTLLHLISQSKDLSKPKYGFLIKKRENTGIKHFSVSKVFIESSNTMNDLYENIYDYKPNRKRKTLIVFDDMIVDIMTNKNSKLSWKNCLLDVEN